MGVDHGGFDVFVSHEFLNGSDVSAGFEQVRSEGMAQRVSGDAFVQLQGLAAFCMAFCSVLGEVCQRRYSRLSLSHLTELEGNKYCH